ncbi:MAG: helix-turn-helix transcriptional regulator [Lachnospiraceae bacterium]|nr:helix-turn-helix transcriptional regulator [Lachnospiraceae bacterium]
MDRDEIARKLGLNIRRFRNQRLLSQESLALDAGIHPAYLGKLERGEKCPNIDTLLKICSALDIPAAKLLDFDIEAKEENSATKQRLDEAMNRLSPSKQRRVTEIVENIVNTIVEDEI